RKLFILSPPLTHDVDGDAVDHGIAVEHRIAGLVVTGEQATTVGTDPLGLRLEGGAGTDFVADPAGDGVLLQCIAAGVLAGTSAGTGCTVLAQLGVGDVGHGLAHAVAEGGAVARLVGEAHAGAALDLALVVCGAADEVVQVPAG